eukprot:218833-Prymnesium_polylepis.1
MTTARVRDALHADETTCKLYMHWKSSIFIAFCRFSAAAPCDSCRARAAGHGVVNYCNTQCTGSRWTRRAR